MPDDVDDLLRRTMATLDRQVPAGYFATLADRVTARLDEPAGAATGTQPQAGTVPPEGDELARERARRGAAVPAIPAIPVTAMPAAQPTSPEPRAQPGRGRHLAVGAAFGVSVAAAIGVMIFISVTGQRGAPVPTSRNRQGDAPASAGAASDSAQVAPGAAAPDDKASPTGKPDTNSPPENERATGKRPPSKLDKLDRGDAKGSGAKGEVARALSRDDFRRGMDAVAVQARGCAAGAKQNGTASLQVTVAPTGKVTRVVVSGVFAGTSVATCIERAVRSAKFPSWAGKPQSFAHSYLVPD